MEEILKYPIGTKFKYLNTIYILERIYPIDTSKVLITVYNSTQDPIPNNIKRVNKLLNNGTWKIIKPIYNSNYKIY